MIWLLALSAVVNIILGYALAVYLGNCCAARTANTPCMAIASVTASSDTPHQTPPQSSDEFFGALQQIQRSAADYHERLTETDQRLRSGNVVEDPSEFSEILRSVLDAAETYTRQRDGAHSLVTQLRSGVPGMQTVCKDLDSAIRREDSEIAAARAMAGEVNASREPAAQTSAWFGLVGGMLDAGCVVRSIVDDALGTESAGASSDARPNAMADMPPSDRNAAETHLARWRRDDPQCTRTLSAAMLDIDRFADVHQQHGQDTADKTLDALHRWMAQERPEDSAEGFSGQRFLLFFPDSSLREAFEPVERLRQSIERMRFRSDSGDFQITACCAIVEASANDAPETLLSRIEFTLAEARRAGQNRTFVHEGGVASPLIPIEMSVEERQILV